MRRSVQQRFGDRLKALRLEREWSQEDLAEKAGINRAFISLLENGHKEPCLVTIETLAGSFAMSISDLMLQV